MPVRFWIVLGLSLLAGLLVLRARPRAGPTPRARRPRAAIAWRWL